MYENFCLMELAQSQVLPFIMESIKQQDQGYKAPSTSPFYQLKMETLMDRKYLSCISRNLKKKDKKKMKNSYFQY